MTCKQARKQMEMSSLGAQKAFKIRSQKHPKINENPVPDSLESILLLPWSSKVLPRCQNGFPGCQNGGTKPPNGNRKELKGAVGKRRSP